MANFDVDRYTLAQQSVIGSMLLDSRKVPMVLAQVTEDDFLDPTCRNFFRAIRELAVEGSPIDPVPVLAKLKNGDAYVQWYAQVMDITPTPANVEIYAKEVREGAVLRRFWALCGQGQTCIDLDTAAELVLKMSSNLSATDRMPMMTAAELTADFLYRMRGEDKPKYLPWGIPTADRNTYAELGDMILLGGYASSGKTLLSIQMAMAQAKAGYKVGYYSLESKPRKMADRIFSALSKVPLEKIKEKEIGDAEWERFSEAGREFTVRCPFAIIQAAEFTVDDITAHALGHGFQIIYVDYVQLVPAPGRQKMSGYDRVTAVSQKLKGFAQRTNIAVVALAQLSRPGSDEPKKQKGAPAMPTMHSFKESGQLEQDADVAFLVYPTAPKDGGSTRFFRIAKNKEGRRPDPVELAFYGDIQTMVELDRRPDHSVAAEMSAKGRAIKQANRVQSQQVEFRELRGGDEKNPFEEEPEQ